MQVIQDIEDMVRLYILEDSTCTDYAPSMDIRPGVPDFQLAGFLIRKIVLFFIIFDHIFTRSLGLSTLLLLASVEGTGAILVAKDTLVPSCRTDFFGCFDTLNIKIRLF